VCSRPPAWYGGFEVFAISGFRGCHPSLLTGRPLGFSIRMDTDFKGARVVDPLDLNFNDSDRFDPDPLIPPVEQR
jgi:hypothetical protein